MQTLTGNIISAGLSQNFAESFGLNGKLTEITVQNVL